MTDRNEKLRNSFKVPLPVEVASFSSTASSLPFAGLSVFGERFSTFSSVGTGAEK